MFGLGNYKLYPFQEDAIGRIWNAAACGYKRILLQAETGSGKTICACHIIHRATAKNRHVLFVAPARELIHQCSDKLTRWGVHHGIIMAKHGYTKSPVQLTSKDTFHSRVIRRQVIEPPPAHLVFIDEAHLSTGPAFKEIYDLYPDSYIIGLSATPSYLISGKGLGNLYQTIICASSTSELIAGGYIVPTKVYGPYNPNLKGIKHNPKGDFLEGPLSKRMDRPRIIGNVVKNWKKFGENRPTFVFAVNVQHSRNVVDAFNKAGIVAEHIEANTDPDKRKEIFDGLIEGRIKIVSSCGVLTTGIDIPVVSCSIMLRPTESFPLWRQMIGRPRRAYTSPEGVKKEYAILLDHSGNIFRHGFPDEDVEWTLETSESINQSIRNKLENGEMAKPITCPKCARAFSYDPAFSQITCPQCGHVFARKKKDAGVAWEPGFLVSLNKGDVLSEQQHRALVSHWHACLGIAAYRNATCGFAVMLFRKKFHNPPWKIPHMVNLPEVSDLKRKVRDVFPQYYKGPK